MKSEIKKARNVSSAELKKKNISQRLIVLSFTRDYAEHLRERGHKLQTCASDKCLYSTTKFTTLISS